MGTLRAHGLVKHIRPLALLNKNKLLQCDSTLLQDHFGAIKTEPESKATSSNIDFRGRGGDHGRGHLVSLFLGGGREAAEWRQQKSNVLPTKSYYQRHLHSAIES